ncbi:MAG: protein kinase [Vicinamibacterales bacterium]
MALSSGTRLGPYEIHALLGEGGMGQVYRATDTKLDRAVAIKVLPESFALDADRVARFTREAKTLAALNHPNIAQVYGIEESESGSSGVTASTPTRALVMELVEGEDLAQIIARGGTQGVHHRIPVDEALAIAKQVADALEAAHEQGIVHRDLKPANIKVRPDGTVKVLDFGLAKALTTEGTGATSGASALTLTSPAMTEMGMILGTAAYMAPEQARGKAVDRRADIWAFGCVLYEMLTGRRAFDGEDVSLTLSQVLQREPDFDVLPPDVPPAVRRLLRRCFEKDPRRRLSAIGDARLELEERDEPAPAAGATTGAPVQSRQTTRLVATIAAAVVVTAAATYGLVGWSAGPPAAPQRLTVLPPAGQGLLPDPAHVMLSPDGRRLAFIAGVSPVSERLWIRNLDDLVAREVEGSDGASLPFWSPDSTRVGFFAAGKLLTTSVTGGRPQIVADAPDGRGATWSTGGVIVFAPSGNGPLFRVSEGGGAVTPATSVDADKGESGHRFPSFLPDGRHFLFAVLPQENGLFHIDIGELDSPDRQNLMTAENSPVYAEPGYLIFSRNGTLAAQPFDASNRTLTGEAVLLDDAPGDIATYYAADWIGSVSSSGDLAYLTTVTEQSRLAWLDQAGRETGTVDVPPGPYIAVSLSPDGRRAVVGTLAGSDSSIGVVDLARGGLTPIVTRSRGWVGLPEWSPDSRRIAFSSDQSGQVDLYVSGADHGDVEPLYQSAVPFKHVTSWSKDGKIIVFSSISAETADDLWTLRLDDGKAEPFVRLPGQDEFGALSPDGRWMAYISQVAGRPEAFVQAFPGPGEAHRVTRDGAQDSEMWWRDDGRQLMVIGADLQVLLIDLTFTPDISVSAPRPVGRLRFAPVNTRSVDATPDLQRMLAIVPEAGNSARSITVLKNWLHIVQQKAR